MCHPLIGGCRSDSACVSRVACGFPLIFSLLTRVLWGQFGLVEVESGRTRVGRSVFGSGPIREMCSTDHLTCCSSQLLTHIGPLPARVLLSFGSFLPT